LLPHFTYLAQADSYDVDVATTLAWDPVSESHMTQGASLSPQRMYSNTITVDQYDNILTRSDWTYALGNGVVSLDYSGHELGRTMDYSHAESPSNDWLVSLVAT